MTKSAGPLIFALVAAVLTSCRPVEIVPYDPGGISTELDVAMISMECELDAVSNRRAMIDYITAIASTHPDVDLICFGETTLGWYWKPFGARRYQEEIAEPLDGPTVTAVRALADQYDVHISFGFAEADNGRLYNAAVIVGPDGEIVAHRRKSHFVIMDRFSGYTPGEKQVTTAFIGPVKVALLICNDFNSRTYQAIINGDPEIRMLLLPHATANLEPDFWERYRYNFKGLWMLSAQRYGSENRRRYYGSWILDPNGYMTAHSGSGPGYFVYTILVAERK